VPIVAVLFAALVFGGAGFAVGGGMGALAVELLHQRCVRARGGQGAEIQPEEWNSAGCGALLAGSLLGGVFGCLAMLILGCLVLASGAE
jgi:hypothetical protein